MTDKHDDALIAEALRNIRSAVCWRDAIEMIDALLAKLQPVPEPDRWTLAAQEVIVQLCIPTPAADDFDDAVEVLRKHFPDRPAVFAPIRVIQAAKCLKDGSPKGGSAELCADFILSLTPQGAE